MKAFVVALTHALDPQQLLTTETRESTGAVVMSLSEAKALGLAGIQPDAKNRPVCIVVVRPDDANWIQRSLDSHGAVAQYQVLDVEF